MARHTPARLHPLPLRIIHWTNALAMVVMILSGWGIYNDYVIVSGWSFPDWAKLGGWAAESLQWHFAAMWLLAANGIAYLSYGVWTGRLRRKLLPIRPREVRQVIIDTLHLKLGHDDVRTYNAVQKILYIVVILAGILQVVSGLALWKPVQFAPLVDLFGGFQGTRIVHFGGMAVIVGFLVVHVALAVLVPSTLRAMLTGGPVVEPEARDG